MERTLYDDLTGIQLDWNLTDEQMSALVHVPVETFRGWVRRGQEIRRGERPADPGTIPPGMDSVVPLVSVRRHLQRLLPEAEAQARWLATGHQAFDGGKPIDVAASSLENLYWLSYFLESAATQKPIETPSE